MVTIDSVGHFPQLVAPDELLGILDLVLGAGGDEEAGAGALALAEGMNNEVPSGGLAQAAAEVQGDIDVVS
jgi:hypothetical protein